MPNFICFLNWTDEGATKAKDIAGRHDAACSLAESLGGKVVGGCLKLTVWFTAFTLVRV